MSTIDRRSLMARGAVAAGGAVLGSALFQTLNNAAGAASPAASSASGGGGGHPRGGYGPLMRMPDQNGQEILALPDGFTR
jgi:hypothetical protein